MTDDDISKLYTDTRVAGSYGGVKKFYNNLSIKDKEKFKYSDVEKWLSKQDIQQYVKNRNKRIKGVQFYVSELDEVWQGDVAYASQMSSSKKDKFMSFLLIIDVFSRFCFARPLKKINSENVLVCFKDILKSTERKCKKIQFDKGSEFKNSIMVNFLERNKIKYYFVTGSSKAAFAERCILSIKRRLGAYVVYHNGKKKWWEGLEGIIYSYNNTIHSSHGFAPGKIKPIDQNLIWMRTYKYNHLKFGGNKLKKELSMLSQRVSARTFKFKIHDRVRISVFKDKMLRAYSSQFTDEVFTIIDTKTISGYFMYLVKDFNNSEIEGYFYENELLKVNIEADQIYKIEKIMKQTRFKVYVKWLHWPNKFNSWVDKTEVIDMEVEL